MNATTTKCDLKIVDLDEKLTSQSDTAPGLRYLYLRLSGIPSGIWTEIFDIQWQSQWYNMKRRAWVDGKHIVVDCVPEEMKTHHFPRLKEVVATTNSKYDEYMLQQQKIAAQEAAAAARERDRVNGIKAGLDFS